MLSLFLFLNLFLHIIYFSYLKIEGNTYIYRLTIISLVFCLADNFHNIILLAPDSTLTLFNDSLRFNTTIQTQESFILIIALILLIAQKDYKFKSEFYLLLFTNIISANFLLESFNFIVLFISWELFNLSLYIMIIGNGVNKQQALAASLKYFLLSALSTAFLLLALTMIYHITGSLEFEPVYLAMSNQSLDLPVILIIFALLFKLGAAPLHFWSPDLYDSTPLTITAYISNIPKIVYLLLIVNQADLLDCQSNFFIIAGFCSLIVGTLGLTMQFKIKRFQAFSGIANLGYLLVIINNPDLLVLNLIIYILATINIFIVLLYLENLYQREIDDFRQLTGLFYLNPLLTLSLTISIFSLAAIPPLPGFYAKQKLLLFAYKSLSTLLFAIIIFTTVLAISNYLRLIYQILFSKSHLAQTQRKVGDKSLTTIIQVLTSVQLILFTIINYLPLYVSL